MGKIEKKEKEAAGKEKETSKSTAEETLTYYCITCEKVFEVQKGEKPRCPLCLSIHSVELYKRKPQIKKANIRLAAIIAGLIIIAGAAYAIMHFVYGKKNHRNKNSYVYTFNQYLEALKEKGITQENGFYPFKEDGLKEFTDKVIASTSPKEKGEKLFKKFMEMKSNGGFVPFIPRQARPTPPMNAAEVLKSIKKNEKIPLYSLELATMFVTAMRIAGIPSLVLRIDDYKGIKSPLDPSGNCGHFAAGIYDDENFKGSPSIIDLHQGKIFPADAAIFSPLSDIQVSASYMGLEAFYLTGVNFDNTKALSKVEDAILIFPSSAELHSLKGLIYIASGGVEEGKEQIRKALTIRRDAQRILKLAALQMAEGETEQAIQQIRTALDLKPDYTMAHATLAMALLAEGESDEARNELDIAKKIDPNDPLIPLYEANYYLERGQITKALEQAEKAYENSFGDPQIGLLLASLYEKTGEKKKLRALLDKILTNDKLPSDLKKTIQEKFNYSQSSSEEEEEEKEALPDLGSALSKKGSLLRPGEKNMDEEEGEGSLKLKLGTQGGLLRGKDSNLDLQLR